MSVLYWREHETGDEPRIRVWSDEQARYGQFDILDHQDFLRLQELATKYSWPLHQARD